MSQTTEDFLTDFTEMSSLSPKNTGVDATIWFSPKYGQLSPCIKVYKFLIPDNDGFAVSISDTPSVIAGNSFLPADELEKVFKFVILNKEVLIDYWNYKLYTSDVIDKLKS